MEKPSQIIPLIKGKNYSNPFSDQFDLKMIKKDLQNETDIAEVEDILEFLAICNKIHRSALKDMYTCFDELNLSPDDLTELCFASLSRTFIYVSRDTYRALSKEYIYEAEKTRFTKIKDGLGKEIDTKFALEIGVDVLAEFLRYLPEWKPKSQGKFNTTKLPDDSKSARFINIIFACLNTSINVRTNAYEIVFYEQGKIIFRDEKKELKIESFFELLNNIKTANDIRSSNHIREFERPLSELYKQKPKLKMGLVAGEVKDNILNLSIANLTTHENNLIGETTIMVYFPHLMHEKLKSFDGLTINDLTYLFSLIQASIAKISEPTEKASDELKLTEIPFKIKHSELVQLLEKCTNINKNTLEKFIESLCFRLDLSTLWNSPFVKKGEFLYFHVLTLTGPNITLFEDKWSQLEFTLPELEIKFRDFIVYEFRRSDRIGYKFKIHDNSKLKLDKEKFANNIVIELKEIFILIEVKCFPFPIESPEYEKVMQILGYGTDILKDKELALRQALTKKNVVEPKIEKIIITNYTNLSGLVLNEIPVLDLVLFKNYVSTGKYHRQMVSFHNGKPVGTDAGSYNYYDDEAEFNNNFQNFCLTVPPVTEILKRFKLREQVITPEFINPRFIVNMTDHVSDQELVEDRIENLSNLLRYEYYSDLKKRDAKKIDEHIYFSLSEIFNRIAYAKTGSQDNRLEIYSKISKVKLLGFAHLSYFILKGVEFVFVKKNVKEKTEFKPVKVTEDELEKLLDRFMAHRSGQVRLSSFSVKRGTFKTQEIKKLLTFAKSYLGGLSPKNMFKEVDDFFLPLLIIRCFRNEFDLSEEFYSACGNIIDSYNLIHQYQPARDFCEEILICAFMDKKPIYGWNILFKCYTDQNNLYDSAINGCILMAACNISHQITYKQKVDVLNNTLKFFRNFRYYEYAKFVYDNLKTSKLGEYDEQKIALSYFNSFLTKHEPTEENAKEIIDFFNSKKNSIITFRDYGIVPWLGLFYNLRKLKSLSKNDKIPDVSDLITLLEKEIDGKLVQDLKDKILGNIERSKELFISAILNSFRTRSSRDFIYESKNLSILGNSLLQYSIEKNDIAGIFLVGLVSNDQSFMYKEVNIEPGTLLPTINENDLELEERLRNYDKYLLGRLNLKKGQVFLWIFQDHINVYGITINSNKEVRLFEIVHWELDKMREWNNGLSKFYFNSKKEKYYDLGTQESRHNELLKELSFTEIPVSEFEEILICTDIELSEFPHNLIEINGDFAGRNYPICNIISIERYLEKGNKITLNSDYTKSSWLPIHDGDATINWGYNLLLPILESVEAKNHTSRYPENKITTDLNIFMAHGVVDGSGFKAVYSNEGGATAIQYPYQVFGEGKIAILFICNSASISEELFSNNINSFSGELLKGSYDAVVAPFWKFDVTISPIWLKAFLEYFNSGFSISEAVFKANKKVSEYDVESGSLFYAPEGSLAMHLYGNPNIYVSRET